MKEPLTLLYKVNKMVDIAQVILGGGNTRGRGCAAVMPDQV